MVGPVCLGRIPRLTSALVTAAICFLGAGCTALLDFSDPIERVDAGIDGGTPSAPDAMIAVCTDSYEPNDTADIAPNISPMLITSALCKAGDVDIYSFNLSTVQNAFITLNSTGSRDADLHLLNQFGTIIAGSEGTGTDRIEEATLAAGDYFAKVSSTKQSGSNSYELTLETTAP